MGLVRGYGGTLAPATTSDHPSMGAVSGSLGVTSDKRRVRESRLPGSVRAEPNGRATRPRPPGFRHASESRHSVVYRNRCGTTRELSRMMVCRDSRKMMPPV